MIGTNIQEAVRWLKQDEVIAMPTETVYGLAANALSDVAVSKIFNIKNRPTFDPLIVHIASLDKLERYVHHIPKQAFVLMEKFWPGPLTILLPKQPIIPDLVTAGLNRVGIRMPNHTLAQAILQEVDFPLAAPSANPFGYVSPTTTKHVHNQLGNKIPYIVEGGSCHVGVESTIIGFEHHQPIVYRLGGITIENLEAVLGPIEWQLHGSNPKAPGQLDSHYAPLKKIVIGDLTSLLTDYQGKQVGVISFTSTIETTAPHFHYTLSSTGSLAEAAQHIFAALRYMDTLPIDVILAELVPNEGLGRAINDRLKRAAYR